MDEENKYGLAFVLNFTMLGSLRIVLLGLLFLVMILSSILTHENSWILLWHLAFCVVVAVALGIYDAKSRFTLLQKHFSEYNQLGKRYMKLCTNPFHYVFPREFGKAIFKVRWNSGEYYIFTLSISIIVMAVFMPWFLMTSTYGEFFSKDFQQSFPFFLAFVTLSICRVVRFLYWMWPLASLIQKKYGYSRKDIIIWDN